MPKISDNLSEYSNSELSEEELKEKIEKLIKFFEESGISYEKYDSSKLPKLNLTRQAYPNFDYYQNAPPTHDLNKWLQTIKEVYYKENTGLDRKSAIKQSTAGWKITEIFDFLNWLKYYEEGAHMKYKKAQLWYENGSPGYFLHIKPDPPVSTPTPSAPPTDINEAHVDEISPSEKKRIIEKQRHKIIGRLDSAEKLLRTPEGQLFAGKELEALMEAIYSLKKSIQLVNKISASTRLYEDMIVRESNILNRKGFKKAASHLYALSQAVPTPANPAPPTQMSGAPGGLPSTGPGMPQNPPDSAPLNESGIAKFLENMETGNITKKEDSNDIEVSDELDVEDEESELLVSEAQATPGSPAPPAAPPAPPADKGPAPKPGGKKFLEVKEEESSGDKPGTSSDFDNILDSALSNLKVEDVIAKLEDLSKIFKTREVPRQLSIVDMMLDSLGLASFFPSLSEATNKALESNNYISTRIDDILLKLQGSVGTQDIDLRGGNPEADPAVAAIRDKLQKDQDKEKARKQMRKEQENAELDSQVSEKETPEVEIQEDLAAPAGKPAPTPAPAKPV